MSRTLTIVHAFVHLAWRARAARRREPSTVPEEVRRTLEHLGTTFIKLGQALSMRWDLFPSEYRAALSQLQHHVTPFPAAAAVIEIEAALGGPIERLFARFDQEPMAAASIAQVHRATLHDGGLVIVKVRRPGVETLVRSDLRVLRRLARAVQVLSTRAARLHPVALVDELEKQLLAEINLAHEARNIRRLETALRGRPEAWLPEVIEPWATPSVIVQRFSPGAPISDSFGTEDGRRLAATLIDLYLFQIFAIGAYHADPHPGNLFVLPDGRLCFHDFGLIGMLDTRSRSALRELLAAVAFQDAPAAVDAAVELGVLAGSLDRRTYERTMDGILSDLAASPLGEWSLADTVMRIARIGDGADFRVPPHLLVLVRTLYLLESTARQLDSQLNLADALLQRVGAFSASPTPPASRRALRRAAWSEAMRASREVPHLLLRWLRRAQSEDGRPTLSIHHRGLDALDETIARTGNRLALGMVTLGAYVAASLLMLHSAGPRILDGVPIFALIAFVIAVVLTAILARAILRSGRL